MTSANNPILICKLKEGTSFMSITKHFLDRASHNIRFVVQIECQARRCPTSV